ncbi:MAG: hypothetical protein E7287_03580 [Lachnospiraceae bacterium]|nr:hypothetical protein [Lachnospiraceae bacterium]
MNFTIAFFIGCITLVLMLLIKIPVKTVTKRLADESFDERGNDIRYKRYNMILFILVFVVACVIYYLVLLWLGDDHFKFCCSLKAGIIAIALYSVFERFL